MVLCSTMTTVGYMGPRKNPTNDIAIAFSHSEGTSQTVSSRLDMYRGRSLVKAESDESGRSRMTYATQSTA